MFTCARVGAISLATALLTVGAIAGPPAAGATVLDGCIHSQSDIDLNGDGFDDAVVGDPYATVDGQAEAGQITVLFGDADGRIGEGLRRTVTQADLGETPEPGDHFGWSVAVGRADQLRNCASILVGAPGEDLDGLDDAGTAHLAAYLTDDEGQPTDLESSTLTQSQAGGVVEQGDEFGYAVALAGPTHGDPYALVIGAPGETVGSAADAGAINLFEVQGSPRGVGQFEQGSVANSSGDRVPGSPQSGDRFGTSLAAKLRGPGGSFVVGAPGDVVNGKDGAGTITVFLGEDDDGPFTSVRQYSEDSRGVRGVAEAGDNFGFSVAVSPFASGFLPQALAVGVPGEDRGAVVDAGAVALFSSKGGTLTPRANLTQATAGVPGTVETGDQFGYSLAYQYSQRLFIGVPFEDIGDVVDAGSVQPVETSAPGMPLTFGRSLTEDAPGTAYGVAEGSRFGAVLSGLDGVRENVFTVSSPFQGDGSVYVVSDRSGADGRELPPRTWLPGQGGIPASPGGRFGSAVSGMS